MSFTPGPWMAEFTQPSKHIEGYWEIAPIGFDGGPDWRREVATTADGNKANADLIAAAPDLLEALKAARMFIRNGVEFGYIQMPDPALNDSATRTPALIDAAIAKAEGR